MAIGHWVLVLVVSLAWIFSFGSVVNGQDPAAAPAAGAGCEVDQECSDTCAAKVDTGTPFPDDAAKGKAKDFNDKCKSKNCMASDHGQYICAAAPAQPPADPAPGTGDAEKAPVSDAPNPGGDNAAPTAAPGAGGSLIPSFALSAAAIVGMALLRIKV